MPNGWLDNPPTIPHPSCPLPLSRLEKLTHPLTSLPCSSGRPHHTPGSDKTKKPKHHRGRSRETEKTPIYDVTVELPDQHQTTTVFTPDSCFMRCVTQATIRLLFFCLQPKACLWSFPIPNSSHLTCFASLLTYYFHLAPAPAPRLLQFPFFFSYSHPPLTAHNITVGSDAQLPFSFFWNIYLVLAASGFCGHAQDLSHGLRVH